MVGKWGVIYASACELWLTFWNWPGLKFGSRAASSSLSGRLTAEGIEPSSTS